MKTIAVIFGGRSTEHDVSIITALASIVRPLELAGEYKVVPIYIARDGAWYSDPKLTNISVYSSGTINSVIRSLKPVSVKFDGALTIHKASSIAGRKQFVHIDIAFPAMHGTYGEDGSLMGMLEMAGVPYVGCGVAASAVAMDKVLAKQIAVANSIPTSKFLNFLRPEFVKDPDAVLKDITNHLKYPLFVKPAHLGSSIGISRVINDTELMNGLEVAAHYDHSIIVEEAVANLIEVTLPIMGNDEPLPALLERPLAGSEDFFDFDTKYMGGGKKSGQKNGSKGAQGYSQIPAELSKDLYAKAEHIGLRVYKALGCTGTARVDMLIDSKTGEVYFNEVNPLPGSLYAHNWRAAGISGVDLVRQLVGYAEERYVQQQQLATSFSTNFLKQF